MDILHHSKLLSFADWRRKKYFLRCVPSFGGRSLAKLASFIFQPFDSLLLPVWRIWGQNYFLQFMAKNLPLGRFQLKGLILLSNLSIDNNLFYMFFIFSSKCCRTARSGWLWEGQQTDEQSKNFWGQFCFLWQGQLFWMNRDDHSVFCLLTNSD